MHGSRCSHSAESEPKSSPLHPCPGHLKLSKVPGSSAWCGEGNHPLPHALPALEQQTPRFGVAHNFQEKKPRALGYKVLLGMSRGPLQAGCVQFLGGFPLPPL